MSRYGKELAQGFVYNDVLGVVHESAAKAAEQFGVITEVNLNGTRTWAVCATQHEWGWGPTKEACDFFTNGGYGRLLAKAQASPDEIVWD